MVRMATSGDVVSASDPRSPQFSLRGMLLLTAAVAVACALISWLGAAWLPLVLGMTLYLANYLGMFGLLQRRVVAQTVLYLAAIAWTISLFLPVERSFSGGTTTLGGEMAWSSVVDWSGVLPEHRGGIAPSYWGRLLLRAAWLSGQGLASMANAGMVLCPLLAHRLAVGKARWLQTMLVVSTPVVWICCFYFVPTYGILFGIVLQVQSVPAYFVWCGALTMTAVVLRISWWQLIAVAVVSLWLAVGAWAWISWLKL